MTPELAKLLISKIRLGEAASCKSLGTSHEIYVGEQFVCVFSSAHKDQGQDQDQDQDHAFCYSADPYMKDAPESVSKYWIEQYLIPELENIAKQ